MPLFGTPRVVILCSRKKVKLHVLAFKYFEAGAPPNRTFSREKFICDLNKIC